MTGAVTSILVGVIAVGIGMGIGVALGMLSGYFGGWLDEGFMRLMDAIQGFPAILSALLIAAVFRPSLGVSMVAIGVAFLPVFARLTRASFLEFRDREFVLAARALGAGDAALIGRHILPNTLPPLIVQATISFPVAILAEAGLSYLGLGTQPPHPSWGLMLKEAQAFLGTEPVVCHLSGRRDRPDCARIQPARRRAQGSPRSQGVGLKRSASHKIRTRTQPKGDPYVLRLLLAMLATLLVTQAAVIATSVYLHRGLAHRALKLHPIADWFFRFILWITTGQNRREWVAVHRKHHAFTDTEKGPAQPARARLLEDPARERLLLRPRGPQPRDARALGQGHQGRHVGPRALQQGHARRRRRRRLAMLLLGPIWGFFVALTHFVLYVFVLAPVHQRARPLVGAEELPRQQRDQYPACSPGSPAARACTTTTTPIPRAPSSAWAASSSIPRGW